MQLLVSGATEEMVHAQFLRKYVATVQVRILFIILMIGWTGLAPWEFEFHFTGSLTSTFLGLFLSGHAQFLRKYVATVQVYTPRCFL